MYKYVVLMLPIQADRHLKRINKNCMMKIFKFLPVNQTEVQLVH